MLVVFLSFSDVRVSVVLFQPFAVQFNWRLSQRFFLPEIRRQVRAGLGDGLESGLGEVTEGGSATLGAGVNVFVTGISQNLLGDRSSNNTGTSGSRDQSHVDGTAFGMDLAGNGVGFTQFGAPVASSDGNDG